MLIPKFRDQYPTDPEISGSVPYWFRNFEISTLLIPKFRDQYPSDLEISRSVGYWSRNFVISTYWMRKFSRSQIFYGSLTPRASRSRQQIRCTHVKSWLVAADICASITVTKESILANKDIHSNINPILLNTYSLIHRIEKMAFLFQRIASLSRTISLVTGMIVKQSC